MNSVIIIGNLTRDPETRYSTGMNQTAICRFTVAVNDGYGDKERTSFIPVVVFGKQGENCDRFLSKGRKVCVSGRIQTGSYEKDGRTVYTTDVIANRVEFLGSGQGGSQGGYGASRDSFGGYPEGNAGSSQPVNFDGGADSSRREEPVKMPEGDTVSDIPGGFTSLQDDDIPF